MVSPLKGQRRGSLRSLFLTVTGPAQAATLQDMTKNWPFFRSVLSLVEMVLYKADSRIANRYSQVCAHHELHITGILGSWHTSTKARVPQETESRGAIYVRAYQRFAWT